QFMPAATEQRPIPIVTRGDPGWDEARRAWNLAVDQRPAAVAVPRSVDDAAAAVGFARRRGLRVAAQGTGHGAAALGPLAGTVLVKTHAMRRVSIDPAARIARAEAGARWGDVVEAAARHGLAALAGSSPNVGVAGYTLGGGMSWLGRAYGLSANNVEAIELVTADGRFVRADACSEPDLFWALRGGGGSFGVVTAIELRLFPIREVYGGSLWWPIVAGESVLQAWRELTQSGLPDEFTTSFRFMRFPPLPDVPGPVRGRWLAIVDVVHLGTSAEADRLLAPLRAVGPINDTIQTMPVRALSHLRSDPGHPVPGVGDGLTLSSLTPEAAGAMTRVAGAGTASLLTTVELRHAGGEMRRVRPGSGALAAVQADYALFAVGMAPTPDAARAVAGGVAAVKSAMTPWAASQMYLNIAETSRDPRSFWTAPAYDRLRRIKAAVDPGDMIRSNHPIPPFPAAGAGGEPSAPGPRALRPLH
ncbi:MAG TPA: FAD-binding protein, partial [Streptosporangiaceae bacterium]|nr:FAD-binding protein [Streptosporangiaceae bacterium]